jgi:hypothetical protein
MMVSMDHGGVVGRVPYGARVLENVKNTTYNAQGPVGAREVLFLYGCKNSTSSFSISKLKIG